MQYGDTMFPTYDVGNMVSLHARKQIKPSEDYHTTKSLLHQGARQEDGKWCAQATRQDGEVACWIGLLEVRGWEEDMPPAYLKVWTTPEAAPIGLEYPFRTHPTHVQGWVFNGQRTLHAGSMSHVLFDTLKLQIHFQYVSHWHFQFLMCTLTLCSPLLRNFLLCYYITCSPTSAFWL